MTRVSELLNQLAKPKRNHFSTVGNTTPPLRDCHHAVQQMKFRVEVTGLADVCLDRAQKSITQNTRLSLATIHIIVFRGVHVALIHFLYTLLPHMAHESPLTARMAAIDASISQGQPHSQQHRHVEEDNPFIVASSSSPKSLRTPRTPRTNRSQNASMERVHTPAFMDEENNPFMPSHKSQSTPSRKLVSALPQVVDYHKLSSADQETFSGEYSHRVTPSSRRHAYSPAQPSLMSPTSTRHIHYPVIEAVPAPQFTPKTKRSGPSKDSDLIRAKKELKKWEAEFKTTHGRDATQDDIAANPMMGMSEFNISST